MKRFYNFKNKKGAALLFAIMVLMFLAMVSIAFTMLATTAFKTAARDVSRQQSFYFARSVGLAISDQIIENYNMSDIINYLDDHDEIYGSYSIEKIGLNNEQVVDGTNNVRFYYPDETNKNYVYVDVITTYNGATEVVTSVFTCIDESDMLENMFNLFSVYNVYSTQPNNQKFNFANTNDFAGYVSPSIYLYNGEGQPDATYLIENNVSAKLTSNGNITIKSSGASIFTIQDGNITSYGNMVLERITVKGNVYIIGDLTIRGNLNATIQGNLFVRGNVTIVGNGITHQVCTGTIHSTGNVNVNSARVGNIVGGENANITLTSSTAGTINTKGKVVAQSSIINGDVFTGQAFEFTASTITGRVEARGNAESKIIRTTVGTASVPRSVYTAGNLNIQSTTATTSIIYGNVMVEGTTVNTAKAVASQIHGNLTVNSPRSAQFFSTNVVFLIGIEVYGNVDIRGSGATPMFNDNTNTSTLYEYGTVGSSRTKITGTLFVDADIVLGTVGVHTYINLNGAWLNNVQVGDVSVATGQLKDIYALGGKLSGTLIARNVDLIAMTLDNISKISANKPNYEGAEGGNVTIAGRSSKITTLSGVIFAMNDVTLGDFTILPATAEATVRAEGNGVIRGCSVYGELIVDGDLRIASGAKLFGNTDERYIYVNGHLNVDPHLISAGSTRQGSTVGFIGNRIYVNGKTVLNGQVGDIYLMGIDYGAEKLVINARINSNYAIPGVNGVQKLMTDLLIIDSNQGGTIMENPNSIVYIKENVTITGELHIAGTLVIPQSLTNVVLGEVYARKLITPATQISYEDNMDLANKLRGLTEQPTATLNARLTGNLQINTAFTTIDLNKNIGGTVKLDNVTGTVNVNGAIIDGTLSAVNANTVISNATVHSVKTKNLTLVWPGHIRQDVDSSGTVTVGSGCQVGLDSNATTQYTLKAASVVASGVIKNNIMATGNVTINGGTVNYNVQAASLALNSGTIQGNVNLTQNTTSTIGGSIAGNVYSAGTLDVTSGTVGSAGSRFVQALSLNMTGGSLGANTNVHLTSTSTSVNNNIIAVSLNDVRVTRGNLTTINSAVVNGTLYVGGSVTFSGIAPSAKKGLYCGNASQSIGAGSFGAVAGPVHMPNYTGTATFGSVAGELWAPNVDSLTVNGSVTGDLRAKNITLHPLSGTAVSYERIDVGGYLKILSFSSGTMNFNNIITTNTLVVNCDLSTYTTIGTSYSPPTASGHLASGSTSTTFVLFKANVRVRYLNATYRGNAYIRAATFNPATLYADGGVYAHYTRFYSHGYETRTGTMANVYHTTFGAASNGYYKSNYGSLYAGLNTTYSNNNYLNNVTTYSHIDIRYSSGTTFINSTIGDINKHWEKTTNWIGSTVDRDLASSYDGMNERERRRRYSRYYHIAGGLTLNNTRINGITDDRSGDHEDPAKIILHVSSGNLSLTNSSWIGWYNSGIGNKTSAPSRGHQSLFDGIFVSGGNLSNASGSTITSSIYVNGNLNNSGIINQKGSDGVNYCGGKIHWSGSKSNSGWIHYDDIPNWHPVWPSSHNHHGNYERRTTASLYTPNADWRLTTTLNNTVLNGIVNIPGSVVTAYNTNYFSVPSYVATTVSSISLNVVGRVFEGGVVETMKTADEGGLGVTAPVVTAAIPPLMGTIVRINPMALHADVRSTENWNPLAIPLKWQEPTKTVAGVNVALNNRTGNVLNYSHINIGTAGGSVTGRIGLTAVDASLFQYRAGKINDIMAEKGSNDMILYTKNFILLEGWPWQWSTTTRQVGLTFFESGIVPNNVFNTTHRGDSDREGGRLLWGNPGLLGAGGDCVWTFFTCADPRNPYTSAAKDLHIILPASVAMQWSKDKDNALNIIGNGRVFLYLRNGTNIKIVGNGFSNWLFGSSNTFGAVRYADAVTGVLNDNKFTGKLQPRLFLIGVGGSILFEVYDFQTFAYVYMPRGYSYSGQSRNEFKVSASSGWFSGGAGSGQWDIYGMYVTDHFSYGNAASAKVNYMATVPDLRSTLINGQTYALSEFWDYPEDLPRAGLTWKYRGIVSR